MCTSTASPRPVHFITVLPHVTFNFIAEKYVGYHYSEKYVSLNICNLFFPCHMYIKNSFQ